MIRVCSLAFVLSITPLLGSANQDVPYQRCFELAARLHDVPLELLIGVARTESNYDPDARSDANAHGIMQIQWPGTARHLGVRRPAELYNPCLNIALGARYLRELLDRNDGDVERALASYNYGPTRIDAEEEIPAGAVLYASTVQEHSANLRASSDLPVFASSGSSVTFVSSTRADRFARTLNKLIDNAQFEVIRQAYRAHAVTMQVEDEGLSYADQRMLHSLGWPVR